MKREGGNWKDFRRRFGLTSADEVNLHFGRRTGDDSYWDVMRDVGVLVEKAVRNAQQAGRAYVMFIHGWSTSGPGQTTARSVVRNFMRSKASTPFIVKAQSIQHETVFIAKIREPRVSPKPHG